MTKRMIIMLILVGAVFAGIIGYQRFMANMMMQFMASNTRPAATVTAMEASYQQWQTQLNAVGTLRAVQGVDVSSEAPGIVKTVHFKSGDRVNKGDLLLQLNINEDRAHLQSLQAAEKLAEITYKRDVKQLKVNAISKAKLDSSQADLASKKAQVAQQKAVIDKKRIRAPFSGQLGISTVNPGQYLNPADKIVTLQNTESLYIDFSLPQKKLAELSIGQQITISTDAYNEITFSGLTTAINSVIDKNTRNLLIEAKIDNADGRLIPGMFVKVRVNIGEGIQYLTIPQSSISFNAYGATVFIAHDAEQKTKQSPALVAQQVFIKTGDKRGDQVAILDGINEGDMVVTSGQLKLKNGTPLIINNQVLPANDPSPTPQEQ
jgi:membrane fusion protein (multidrug efflux system)